MLFSELAEAELEEKIRPIISSLLEQKANTSEMGEGARIDELNAYIETNLASLKATVDAVLEERKADWHMLNEMFLELA